MSQTLKSLLILKVSDIMGTLILLISLVFVLVALVSTVIVNILVFFKVSGLYANVEVKNEPDKKLEEEKEKTIEVELEDL